MTVACADALLANDGRASAYAWEAAAYGVIKRGYGFGSKTRGSLARNLFGQVVVSQRRLDEWKDGRPVVAELAASPLWLQLRSPRQLATEELIALEPAARMTTLVNNIFATNERAKVTEELVGKLAACGSIDAVAVLWSLLLEAAADGSQEIVWQCARRLPPALALAAQCRSVRRVALLIFARIRQSTLDGLTFEGRTLELSQYDLLSATDSSLDLPTLEVTELFRRSSPVALRSLTSPESTLGRQLIVPEERRAWVLAHLVPEGQERGATGRRARGKWLASNGSLGISPCDPRATVGFHPAAVRRLRDALGDWS